MCEPSASTSAREHCFFFYGALIRSGGRFHTNRACAKVLAYAIWVINFAVEGGSDGRSIVSIILSKPVQKGYCVYVCMLNGPGSIVPGYCQIWLTKYNRTGVRASFRFRFFCFDLSVLN